MPGRLAALALTAALVSASGSDAMSWSAYGGDPGGTRYSALDQIDRAQRRRLEIAWTYRTGELGEGFARADKLAFEATPILVARPAVLCDADRTS